MVCLIVYHLSRFIKLSESSLSLINHLLRLLKAWRWFINILLLYLFMILFLDHFHKWFVLGNLTEIFLPFWHFMSPRTWFVINLCGLVEEIFRHLICSKYSWNSFLWLRHFLLSWNFFFHFFIHQWSLAAWFMMDYVLWTLN